MQGRTVKCGLLNSMGAEGKWSSQFCSLSTEVMSLYENPSMENLLRTIDLLSIGSVEKSVISSHPFAFTITTVEGPVVLSVPTAEDYDPWIESILTTKNNNPLSRSHGVIYSKAKIVWSEEKDKEYYTYLKERIRSADTEILLSNYILVLQSYLSRTYSEQMVSTKKDALTKIMPEVRSLIKERRESFSSKCIWSDYLDCLFRELDSTFRFFTLTMHAPASTHPRSRDRDEHCQLSLPSTDHSSAMYIMRSLLLPLTPNRKYVPQTTFEAQYRKTIFLGSGVYGVVYEVENIATKQRYAAKYMSKSKVSKVDLVYLEREVKIQSMLVHPNIVYLEQFYESLTDYIMVMEEVTGPSLDFKLSSQNPRSAVETESIMNSLLHALAYLHHKGIAHRDLKPQNILFTSQNKLKLTDFGFAKATNEGLKTGCGSLLYMAPEILNHQRYTEKVDIWSAGIIFYQLLCGYPPFNDSNEGRLGEQIKLGRYIPFLSSVQAHARDLCERMLTVDPASRISAEEALKHPWFFNCSSPVKKPLSAVTLYDFRQSQETVIKKGILHKLGKHLSTYHERMIELRHNQLAYFNPATPKRRNVIDLSLVTKIDYFSDFIFVINTIRNIKYTFKSTSIEETLSWAISILRMVNCWLMLPRSQAAFNQEQHRALDLLWECRQNIEICQRPEFILPWRYYSWELGALCCHGIWTESSWAAPTEIYGVQSLEVNHLSSLFCNAKGGFIYVLQVPSGDFQSYPCHEYFTSGCTSSPISHSDVVAMDIQRSTGLLLSGSVSGSFIVWNAYSMVPLIQTSLTTSRIESISACHRHPYAFIGERNGTVFVWNLETQSLLKELKQGRLSLLKASDPYLFVATRSGVFVYSDLPECVVVATLQGHAGFVTSLSFLSPLLVTGGDDNSIVLWNSDGWKRTAALPQSSGSSQPYSHTRLIRSLDISPDGRWIISSSEDEKLILWNTRTYECEYMCTLNGYFKAVHFSNDVCRILSAKSNTVDGWVVDWSLKVDDRVYPPPMWLFMK